MWYLSCSNCAGLVEKRKISSETAEHAASSKGPRLVAPTIHHHLGAIFLTGDGKWGPAHLGIDPKPALITSQWDPPQS